MEDSHNSQTSNGNGSAEGGGQQNNNRRRERTVTLSILSGAIAALVLIVVLTVVLRGKNDNDSSDQTSRDIRERALLNMTFQSVSGTMSPAQEASFTDACTKFYSLNLASLEDVEVLLESQRTRPLFEESSEVNASQPEDRLLQVDQENDDAMFALETVVAVLARIPSDQDLTFTANILADLVNRESSELLYLLTEETDDPYFDSMDEVVASLLADGQTTSPSNGPINDAPSLSPTILVTPSPTIRQQKCNGLTNLCDQRVNDILFATMHNANFYRGVALLVPNHGKSIQDGLEAGIRGLQMDVGKCVVGGSRRISLVNSDCSLGFSDPAEVFGSINEFLTRNPDEVILMPLRIDERIGGDVGLNEVYDIMQGVVNDVGLAMVDRLYSHPGQGAPWPYLQDLIEMDKRIIVFVYDGAEKCVTLGEGCPMGFHDWDSFVIETQTSFISVQEIKDDPTTACSIARDINGTRDFFAINLFVETANLGASAELNDELFLVQHTESCAAQNGLDPNILLVDFWDEGDVLTVVKAYNEGLITPSAAPSGIPTSRPSFAPSTAPTVQKSSTPSTTPTLRDTSTLEPTTANLTVIPQEPTTITPMPVPEITAAPTNMLSMAPSNFPSTKLTSSPVDSTVPPSSSPTGYACNGLENLCDVQVNDMLFATMHNAHASREFVPFAPNHESNVLSALTAGIRGFNLGFGKCLVNGQEQISLVHTSCLAGFADPVRVLTDMHQFLTDNPNEVIIIPAESYDGAGGGAEVDEIYELLEQVVDDAGVSMADRLYNHNGVQDTWPTLGELITDDKRILFFLENGAERCERRGNCPDGIHDWSTWAVETRDDFSTAAEITNDPSEACEISDGNEDGRADFYAINLFVAFPSITASTELNGGDFMRQQLDTCSDEVNLNPNLVVIDFWSQGDVIEISREYNEDLIARSAMPTVAPTLTPTPEPTELPTPVPTTPPSFLPTAPVNTTEPTLMPTGRPTGRPTSAPTPTRGTASPTLMPVTITASPTSSRPSISRSPPTSPPTNQPTSAPSTGSDPTRQPVSPTSTPTALETQDPTLEPTFLPTQ